MSDYIPIELVRNILARLPIEPVLRCTSVCKLWYELINSPSFISSHLNLSVSNNQNRVLVRFCTKRTQKSQHLSRISSPVEKQQFYVHLDNQTFDQIAEVEIPHISARRYFHMVGAINGLFCLSDSLDGVLLWNPSLRKTLDLGCVIHTFAHFYNIGFGFLPSTNTYKIVKFLNFEPPKVEIYELEVEAASTGSWQDVNIGNFPYIVDARSDQAFLNCIVHWTASNPNKVGDFSKLIITFDMKSDKLGALMLPKCMQRLIDYAQLNIYTFREALCVYAPCHGNYFSMWVMKEYGVADSWEELIKIDARPRMGIFFRPLYLRNNGEILLAKKYNKSVDFDRWDLVSYDKKSNRVVDLVDSEWGSFFYAYNYVDSLVLINVGKGQEPGLFV